MVFKVTWKRPSIANTLMCQHKHYNNQELFSNSINTQEGQVVAYTTESTSASNTHGCIVFDHYMSSMLTVAIILFVVGSLIAVANAYYCGKCFSVGQPKEYAHFSPCTFY